MHQKLILLREIKQSHDDLPARNIVPAVINTNSVICRSFLKKEKENPPLLQL